MPKRDLGRHLLSVYVGMIMIFLTLPIVVVIPSAFSSGGNLAFPPEGFSLRWFSSVLTHSQFTSALVLSLALALASTAASLIVGGLAAIALARFDVPGRSAFLAIFSAPLIFPSVVLAVAITFVLAQLSLIRTFAGLFLAHTLIVFPYMVRSLFVSLQEIDRDLEYAAETLGADRWKTFRLITLPLLRPGIIAGVTFSLITSFDDFTVSLFVAGPGLITLPLELYNYTETNLDPTVAAVSSILILASASCILIIEKTVGLARQFGQSETR